MKYILGFLVLLLFIASCTRNEYICTNADGIDMWSINSDYYYVRESMRGAQSAPMLTPDQIYRMCEISREIQ